MLDKLLGSIFDFASSPRGLLSILAGVASAKDRRRDTPAYGGGVSYGMPGPRRLEAVKGLGRYADVMGFSNGGQTVDIRQPLRYGYAQGPYGPLLAYDIPDMTPAPAPAPAPEAPKQTQATQASEGYSGISEPSAWEQMTPQQQAEFYAQNPTMAKITQGLQKAFGMTSLGQLQKALVPEFIKQQESIARGDMQDIDTLAGILGVSPESALAAATATAGSSPSATLSPEEMAAVLSGGSYAEMGRYGGGYSGTFGESSYSAPDYSYGSDPSGNDVTDAGLGGWEGWATGGAVRSYAQGGSVRPFPMQDGGFVMTKRAVDGAGGPRGIAQLLPNARMIRGPGTGTSDSIPATIQGRNGVTPAKVSNGEAYVPPKGVEQAGGARQLYALMNNLQQRA